ncbi:MAG: NAD-dependent epimerase/dehydratase family protein [Verrucomicrobiales bacterium]|nr:NAD-dependent epimerase/dehydratase family protein [Verrucomicrobiales bacterium]
MNVLVTGANGFVGSHVMRSLRAAGHEVTGTVRSGGECGTMENLIVADASSDFTLLVNEFDAVVHAAGVAHNPSRDPQTLKKLFDEGNRDWTRRLSEAVAGSGVKVLIHISSIAAAGEGKSVPDRGFREIDQTEPQTDYGRSKREAEPFVSALQESGQLGVNLRPPLIYGVGTKGNWAKITALAKSGLPVPFAGVRNRRSYLGIENLCDLIHFILRESGRPELSGTYHVADEGAFSLSEIVTALREGLGRKPGMIPFPVSVMRNMLCLVGRKKMAQGLFDDLVLDTTSVQTAFSWQPETPTLRGVKRTTEGG